MATVIQGNGVEWMPAYSKWRHGGWYVTNLAYPNGGCGCVSNNYDDKRWRIVCDGRPFEERPSYATRDEAAHAERKLIESRYPNWLRQDG